ncbi:MAG: multidrug effflux MFS transporter [Pseudoruegeria sp.]
MSQPDFFKRPDAIIYMGGITALTAVSIDLVLPATGLIAREFGAPEEQGALLIGVYFLSYAIGQFFWGLFSDAYGRRLAIILALTGFIAASVACVYATDFKTLLLFRGIQGLVGGTPVIARAMVRDISQGQKAARLMSVLAAILTVATMLAPVLGSGLLVLFDWRAMFIALAILGFAFLIYTIVALPDVGTKRPERLRPAFIFGTARHLFGQRAFVIPLMIGAFSFAGYSAILSTAAIVTETAYDVSPEAFGSLFAIAAAFNTLGALVINRYLQRHSVPQALRLAVFATGVVAIVQVLLLLATPSLPLFWMGMCLYVFAFGLCLPTSMASALEPAGDTPGFAASLIGSIQMSVGAGGAFVASMLFDGTHRAIPAVMVIASGLLITTYLAFPQRKDSD